MRLTSFLFLILLQFGANAQKQWGFFLGPNVGKTIQFNDYYEQVSPHLTYDYNAGLGGILGFQFLYRTSKAWDIRIEPHFQFNRYKSRMNYYENPDYGIVPFYITHKINELQLGLNLNTGISIVNKPGFKLRALAGLHVRAISNVSNELENTMVVRHPSTEGAVSYVLGFGPNAGWEITFHRKGKGQFAIQNIYSLSVGGLSNKTTYGFGLFTVGLGVGYRFTKEKNKEKPVPATVE